MWDAGSRFRHTSHGRPALAAGPRASLAIHGPERTAALTHFVIGDSASTLRATLRVGPHHTRAPLGRGTDRVLGPRVRGGPKSRSGDAPSRSGASYTPIQMLEFKRSNWCGAKLRAEQGCGAWCRGPVEDRDRELDMPTWRGRPTPRMGRGLG